MADEFDPKKFLADTEPAEPAFDPKAFLAQPVERTNTTLADYPEIYKEMRHESQEQIGRGVEQLSGRAGSGYWTGIKGWGNIGLGALGYVGSPIAAGLRATIGEPLQQRTGIPKEYSEFAASLATPGIGLPRIPGTTAPNVLTKITGPRTGPVADETRLLTKGGQETQAGLALRGAATDPAAAERALGRADEILPGSKPTTFQASEGDYGLGQLERGIANKESAPFIERRAQQGAARTEALEGAARPGNPEEVANDLRASVAIEEAGAAKLEREAIARAEERIRLAQAEAQRADQTAGGTGFTPDISGQVFQRELAEANAANRARASSLWDAIDPQGRLSVNASPVINAEFRARSNMTLADAEGVTDAERRIQKIIEQYTPDTSFKEMRSLRSFISESMREERRLRGELKAWGRMAQLRGAVEQTVSAPFERGAAPGPAAAAVSSDAAERLAAATAATKERAATFKVEPVQGILKPGQGGEAKMTPSVVQGRIIPSGPKGYDTVNAYLRATEGRPGGGGLQEVSDALVADMRAHATAVDGSIDPGKLQSWANSKQHALRAVTERDNGALVQRLTGVQDAGREAQAATKNLPVVTKQAAAERAAVSKKGNEGIFGDLMGVRDRNDISKLLGSVFGSKTAVADAEAVMARLATPEAQDGARRAITDWIARKFVSNTAAGTSEANILRADQFQSFIKDNVAVLEKFGFAPEQIKTWQAIAADMRQAKMSIDATRAGAGSDTVQNYYAMKKFGLAGSKLSTILHLAGGSLGALTHGWLGAILGFVGAGKVSALREGAINSVQELIVKGMLEPEFGRQLLAKTSPKESIAIMKTLGLWGKRAARAEVLTGSRHDQSEPAPKGHAYGGTVFPVGSEGIKARNKARAFEARERSAFARSPAQAKGEVSYADGGLTRGSEGGIGDAAGALANDPTIDAMDRMLQNRKLAEGQYDTQLTPDEELKYRKWKAQNAPQDSGVDYDLRGAYKAGVTRDPASGHMPDTFKKPNHPTFSDQSRYAPLAPQRAGRWEGETYIPPQQAFASGGRVKDDSGRVTKASVNYGKGMPKAHCSICVHWRSGKCTEVQGKIWHSMWCELFKRAKKYAGGGAVTEDDTVTEEDPLEAEKKRREVPGGLSATAGPTVTSTTPVQDIPAPKVNSQGETLPTYAIKKMAEGYKTLPQRAGRAAMQVAEGDPDYTPGPILETAKLVMGSPSVPKGALGAGPGSRIKTPARAAPEAVAGTPSIVRSEFDRPLFDYSNMEQVPNVPQFDLPRIIPARGIPEHIMRLGDPKNMERTNQIVQMGMSHGGPEWYNTMPLLERYKGELGPVRGQEGWDSYLKYVGATSPRSPVPLNASVASYYDMLAAQGLPFPQPVKKGQNWSMPRGALPEGYGSLAQATNAHNAQMVRENGGWPSWTFFDKPKPPSFVANLQGNYRPVTSDVHNVSMLDLRGPQGNRLIMPPHPYYGYIEQLQQGPKGAGQFIDLAPAQYQASGWIPWAAGYRDVGRYGEVTGGSPKKLAAYSEPFIKVVEDRVKRKASDLGWSPEQTLRSFLRKEIAIAGVPAAAIPMLRSQMGEDARQQ